MALRLGLLVSQSSGRMAKTDVATTGALQGLYGDYIGVYIGGI